MIRVQIGFNHIITIDKGRVAANDPLLLEMARTVRKDNPDGIQYANYDESLAQLMIKKAGMGAIIFNDSKPKDRGPLREGQVE